MRDGVVGLVSFIEVGLLLESSGVREVRLVGFGFYFRVVLF